ncbi:hypothetical protein [Ancylobacter amanitiformis]|uniref:Uncharacterized protein n=1 Tax=Ancylobacter amanitiformis TaxID=217069 RepID=A0ABU0LQA5_9HYPH|nr:hypothetical protein [Ancylobacter amanitiformis]MDQ0510880.1 hypothetical protein [Ancylobacter amanitiformis]
MKVIVKESGFYAGVWREAGSEPDLPEKIARPFLSPRGHQLALPEPVEAEVPVKAGRAGKAD